MTIKYFMYSFLVLTFSGTLCVAQSNEDKYLKTLQKKHDLVCKIQSKTTSAADRAKAQTDMMEVANEVSAIQMQMMQDPKASADFMKAMARVGQDCTKPLKK